MARLGARRDTHVSEREIAEVTLRLFDEGPDEPTLRGIAAALDVAPASLYHHVPALAVTYQLAVQLIWEEAAANMRELEPNPFKADPVSVLIASAVALRRACLNHHRAARYLAATPEASPFMDGVIALMTHLFVRMGLEGEQAALAMHSYSSFAVGAVLFAAARIAANEGLLAGAPGGRFHAAPPEPGAPEGATRAAIDQVMDVSIADPVRDEELFVEGLRRLIKSLTE